MAKRKFSTKLCSLLVDGSISNGDGHARFQTYKYRYEKLRKKNPKAIFTLERQFRNAIEDARLLLEQW